MFRHVMSRSQRRVEKRQAFVLLLLIFAVSLVSFSLGVMVGRSGSSGGAAASSVAASPRIPVAQGASSPAAASSSAAAPVKEAKDLTFYDSLPKGEQPPLGSGINLPPPAAKEEPIVTEKIQPQKTSSATPAAKPSASTSSTGPIEPKPTPPPPTAKGSFVLQVASFPKAEDALSMKKRLAQKGYQVFTQETDLGAKGVWYRVFVGPYSSQDAAEAAAGRLKAEDKLSTLVRKQ